MENTQIQTEQLSFLDLARDVIQEEEKPLTVDEIWEIANTRGLIQRLRSAGKTPKATLGARLYMQAKIPDGMFVKVGSRPARFILRSLLQTNPQLGLAEEKSPAISPARASIKYHERDLHPVMVYFAQVQFGISCRTIHHERSVKRGQKHDEWLHPDIVGFSLTTHDWEPPVVNLTKNCGGIAAKIYSFEIKIDIDFSTLRQYFFQAVSNSSWAHEGYLAAVNISDDPEFREELTRLSQSFGIGIIRLNLENPSESEVKLLAREREELDWKTINRLAEVNKDFNEFIDCVAKAIDINQMVQNNFERVPTDEEVICYAKKLLSGANVQPAAPQPYGGGENAKGNVYSNIPYILETIDETAMPLAVDAEIRRLLCEVFVDAKDNFAKTRAWHGSGPVYSVIGRINGVLVGHIGVVQRRIRVGKEEIEIFGIQNFAVSKAARGTGLGPALMSAAEKEAQKRGLKWGLLFCVPELGKYYGGLGWRKIDAAVTMINPDSGRDEPIPSKNIAMVRDLAGLPFPIGDIHLMGADW